MNGNRYLFDTNAVIALLQGNEQLLGLSYNARWIGISVITQIEFLAFPGLNDEDKQLFSRFLQRTDVIELSPNQNELIDLIIELRKQYQVKLPDAIIAATAMHNGASLVTADKRLQSVYELSIVDFT